MTDKEKVEDQWHWNPAPHPISEYRDWSDGKTLELQPSFQRKLIWSDVAKIMLIDTILKNIPIPKVYMQVKIIDGKTVRIIIDGQQRINAILGYIRGEYPLDSICSKEHIGKYFIDLSKTNQDKILFYTIDSNQIYNASDDIVREIYHRVNKYTVPLSKQELRRADYPGDFLNVAEKLANLEYLEEARIFTLASTKRMGDVEFTSELLALLIEGPQDKQMNLDKFYRNFKKWNSKDKEDVILRFKNVVRDISILFKEEVFDIAKTRFRQKGDFYSLFAAVDKCLTKGESLIEEKLSLKYLRDDFSMLSELIAPEAEVKILSEYAIKCVSQSNTISSRNWRMKFLYKFLQGTYFPKDLSKEDYDLFSEIYKANHVSYMCQSEGMCAICESDIDFNGAEYFLAWSEGEDVYQYSNLVSIHEECKAKAEKEKYVFVIE